MVPPIAGARPERTAMLTVQPPIIEYQCPVCDLERVVHKAHMDVRFCAEHEPYECTCETALPDAVGECQFCRRRVIR